MALYSSPPHQVTTYTSEASRDLGGGTVVTFTAAQTDLKCSINTASASEREIFA